MTVNIFFQLLSLLTENFDHHTNNIQKVPTSQKSSHPKNLNTNQHPVNL
ncbi:MULTISPECIES: hypothetical protein [Aphanizomenonaceae]|uniref:Uncharacterized protein n=1 Tax=Dolichospermum heterosporum TAC447 TaxID=747523 RepID=A0ABY5LXM7_9CYAN|nr:MULTISPECIES: hypothetical protein [Aphanizomenonaceae]QSV71931.1 MAG: hypothetical protein HEQ20_15735 [Aphanizomenon flos-aquae KM1D3_PB]UUO15507.1 hypothetical protein NG743_00100 [Dolichospermum heterosporum TAC447]